MSKEIIQFEQVICLAMYVLKGTYILHCRNNKRKFHSRFSFSNIDPSSDVYFCFILKQFICKQFNKFETICLSRYAKSIRQTKKYIIIIIIMHCLRAFIPRYVVRKRFHKISQLGIHMIYFIDINTHSTIQTKTSLFK